MSTHRTNMVRISLLIVLYLFSVPAWSCPVSFPVAILHISPDPAVVGQSVLLDGSYSYTSTGTIDRYTWDFTNDGIYDYYETPSYHPDGAFDGKTTHAYSGGARPIQLNLLSEIFIESVQIRIR